MKTLQEYQAEVRASFPWVSADVAGDQGRRQYRLDWHNEQVQKLCNLSSDPDKARALYRFAETQKTLWAKMHKFKCILIGNKLLTVAAASTVPDEPPAQKAGRNYENKALHLMR